MGDKRQKNLLEVTARRSSSAWGPRAPRLRSSMKAQPRAGEGLQGTRIDVMPPGAMESPCGRLFVGQIGSANSLSSAFTFLVSLCLWRATNELTARGREPMMRETPSMTITWEVVRREEMTARMNETVEIGVGGQKRGGSGRKRRKCH